MAARILKGAPLVSDLNEKMKQDVECLKAKGVETTLAVLRVGESDDDKYYERNLKIQAEKIGVEVKNVVLPEDVDSDSFFKVIDELNEDESVHGVLMFMPLPPQLDERLARERLSSAKDIETVSTCCGLFD